MQIQAAQAYIPKPRSLAVKIGEDPSIDFVVGRDLMAQAGSIALPSATMGRQPFVPITKDPEWIAARDTIIGQRFALANASLELIDKGLPLTGLRLPSGTDIVLEVVGVAISGAETYHAFTSDQASTVDRVLVAVNTASGVTELLARMVPVLKPYESALQGVTLIMKVVSAAKESTKAESKYRVLRMKVGG
jgi:hypothetical protein